MTRHLPLCLLTATVAVFSSNGCICIPPEPVDPPKVEGAELSGQVLQVSAQSAPTAGGRGIREARRAVQEAFGGRPLRASDEARDEIRPSGRIADLPTPHLNPVRTLGRAAERRPSELIALFPLDAFDKSSVGPAMADLLRRVDEPLHVETLSCNGRRFCLLALRQADGKPIDVTRTQRIEEKLQKVDRNPFEVVSANYLRRALRTSDDEYLPIQWHYETISLSAAWDITTGSNDIGIAVLDTGVVTAHADLNDRLVPGVDLISDPALAGDGNGRDQDPTDPGDQALGNGGSSWHGTHVAGIIGAKTNNRIGVAGVTWAGRIQPVRVLGIGAVGTDNDILSGLLWALGDTAVEGVNTNPNPSRIVNLSLGGAATGPAEALWQSIVNDVLFTRAAEYGYPVFVVASGNDDSSADDGIPAKLNGVITVGAAGYNKKRAPYSNWGNSVALLAPGGNVQADLNADGQPDGVLSLFGTGYNFDQGTSMATPHVSGVVALMLSVDPGLRLADIREALRVSAEPASQCPEGCGAGHLNAAAALVAIGGRVPDVPVLSPERAQLIFPPDVDTIVTRVYNAGSATLAFRTEIVGAQAQLFSVDRASAEVQPGAAIAVTVTVERANFAAGSANLVLTGTNALSTGLTANVSLKFSNTGVPLNSKLDRIRVGAFTRGDDGRYTLAGNEVFATRAGNFAWKITDLAAGTYYVFGVGDDNNDGTFDAQTESFGGWPDSRNPIGLTVALGDSRGGLNFAMSGGFTVQGAGDVGTPCLADSDCTFAADAECILPQTWAGGYCSRLCDDGVCPGGSECENIFCGEQPCAVCLVSCLSDSSCRTDDSYRCDPFSTCTPEGFE